MVLGYQPVGQLLDFRFSQHFLSKRLVFPQICIEELLYVDRDLSTSRSLLWNKEQLRYFY